MQRHWSRASGWLLIWLCHSTQVLSASAPEVTPVEPVSGQAFPEVTVIGKMDRQTLNHALFQFLRSHSEPSAITGQIGRWEEKVCPSITGLQETYSKFVAERIIDISQSAGVPIHTGASKCTANVEVIFTPEPQAMLDGISKKYRSLLGYFPKSETKQATTFAHPIQAWYQLGSRSMAGWEPPACIPGCGAPSPEFVGEMPPFSIGLQVDSDHANTTGEAGSYLTHGVRSEFLHVLIIVDGKRISGFSMKSVADYVALLALTRIATSDECSELPSILNLFVSNCAPSPREITASDTAYLRALYGADLTKGLNVEQGQIRDDMLQIIESPERSTSAR